MKKKFPISLAAVILILALPFVLSSYSVSLFTEMFVISIFALSLGLIIGYAGLVSLGHAAFFGAGAYTVALLGKYFPNTYVLLLAAILIAGLLAWLSGFLFIKTSGAYFLMITLAFSQMLYAVVYKAKNVTGGADGMAVSASPDLGFGPISSPLGLYYLMAISFLLCYLFLSCFVNSPAGKAVQGVKENESRMKALGYRTHSFKLLAYTISGMMAGFAGAMYSLYNLFVSPDTLSWIFSGQAMVMVIIGGVGTLFGPPIGAAFFVVLQNYMSSYTERWPIIMGLIFVAFVLYGRGGVAHLLIFVWAKIQSNFRGGNNPAVEMGPSKQAGEVVNGESVKG
ncbi:branched-chain amino acid ABC transporter permease [Effusibacillus dendaii]|uniref:Branched-chain amino acid ABC transporter permease n=1 Tax=Effusibacillus dendaii TaxID=2743772 RepID=A0A7I8DDL6_9BACL|nr:branched-chain amino acid ABC transporter permease [Effusibacillus dendaii]BCJ88214.1 branched-chain amino acid ABC transporter permease [Effusibacillus dendaii]